jgi:hypothetical protein
LTEPRAAIASLRSTESSEHLDSIGYDALVARGRRAETEGRMHDAIEFYSSANRAVRDATLEREILRLRHRAAAGPAPELVDDHWPPELTDPFPGVAGLPEITPDALDGALLGGAIRHHGAVLVRGLTDADTATALRYGIDRALEGQADPSVADTAAGWYAVFDEDPDNQDLAVGRAITSRLGGGLLAVDSPRAFFLFAELLADVRFVDAATEYLGERPVLSANKTTFRRLRDAPRPAWHQDGSFMGDVRTVNLWVALSHCGGDTDSLGLDVIPRRIDELLATGTDDAEAADVAIGQRLIERTVSSAMITPEFHPGDALCFDDRFLHRTSAANVKGERHAIEAWFFAPSHFPEQYGALAI